MGENEVKVKAKKVTGKVVKEGGQKKVTPTQDISTGKERIDVASRKKETPVKGVHATESVAASRGDSEKKEKKEKKEKRLKEKKERTQRELAERGFKLVETDENYCAWEYKDTEAHLGDRNMRGLRFLAASQFLQGFHSGKVPVACHQPRTLEDLTNEYDDEVIEIIDQMIKTEKGFLDGTVKVMHDPVANLEKQLEGVDVFEKVEEIYNDEGGSEVEVEVKRKKTPKSKGSGSKKTKDKINLDGRLPDRDDAKTEDVHAKSPAVVTTFSRGDTNVTVGSTLSRLDSTTSQDSVEMEEAPGTSPVQREGSGFWKRLGGSRSKSKSKKAAK